MTSAASFAMLGKDWHRKDEQGGQGNVNQFHFVLQLASIERPGKTVAAPSPRLQCR
jgi:hypothetical protein